MKYWKNDACYVVLEVMDYLVSYFSHFRVFRVFLG